MKSTLFVTSTSQCNLWIFMNLCLRRTVVICPSFVPIFCFFGMMKMTRLVSIAAFSKQMHLFFIFSSAFNRSTLAVLSYRNAVVKIASISFFYE